MNDQCNQKAAAPSKRLRIEPCDNGGFLVEREGERHLQTERFGAYSNARDMIEALMAEFGVEPGELMRFEPPRFVMPLPERDQIDKLLSESHTPLNVQVGSGVMSADDLKAYNGSSMSEEADWPPGEDQTEPTPPESMHTRISAYVIGDAQEITLSPGEYLYSMTPCPDGGFWIVTQQSLTEMEIMAEMHRAAKEAMQSGLN